jgi:hypothetical protein
MCFVLHSLCIRLLCNCAEIGGYVEVKLTKCTMDISKGNIICVGSIFMFLAKFWTLKGSQHVMSYVGSLIQ